MDLSKKIAWCISLPFLFSIALSANLWFAHERSFPQLGIAFLEPLLPYFSGALVLSLCSFLWKNKSKFSKLLCLTFIILCALADIHTVQVWVYFYALLFVILLLGQEEIVLYKTLLIFLAGFYFWSGAHKLNIWYASSEFPWFLSAFEHLKRVGAQPSLAYSSALLELGAGCALLFPNTRRLGLGFLFLLHLFICVLLSPLGHAWNSVVLPWNSALMALLALLFFYEKKQKRSADTLLAKKLIKINSIRFAFVFAWFLPFLSLFGLFERPLSFYVYTGMQSEATLYWDQKSPVTFGADKLQEYVYPRNGDYRLQLADWSMVELGVPPYNSLWALRKTSAAACEKFLGNTVESGYFLLGVGRFEEEDLRTEAHRCGE